MVVKMESKFVIQAIGGSYRNGFGFQLDLIRSQVASVTGTDITDNVVSIGPNGTEDNQNKATIIVFDNAQNTANFASGFMNTVKGNSTIGQDTITVITTFIAPQQASNIGSMPLNPFILRSSRIKSGVLLIANIIASSPELTSPTTLRLSSNEIS